MVQRKFPDKLGIQVDSKNKSERKAKPIKSYSSQHTDIRNKGGGIELTKKMKKSRTFKLSDSEVLGSSSVKRGKSRLNMPSVDVAIDAVTPEKKANSSKLSENSPNYMKSTNSSNAKKERSLVSPYSSTKTSYEKMNQNRRDAKELRSGSDQKIMKSLTKISSLKPVKTLTKTSSMKVARHSKKSSEIALNQKQIARRATCSSTLKDSKFPEYVMIHPGGTESEGTSVMKVCPYTYCSLNGHCHSPLPPLNSFLSARRRSLRTQKSMRHKVPSPAVGTKPSGDSNEEIDTGQLHFSGDPEQLEADTDFFVEIYAKPRKDIDEPNGNDEAEADVSTVSEVLEDVSYSVKDGEASEPEKDCGSTAETPPYKSSYFEFEDRLGRDSDFLMAETYLDHSYQSELESGTPDESELDESMSEATDIDWEERRSDMGLQDELIFKLDDIFSNYSRYVPPNGNEFQTEYEENIENFNARIDDSDYDDRDQISAIDVSSKITSGSSDISHHPSHLEHYSYTEDASNESLTIKEETYGDAEPNGFVNIGISSTSENPLEEPEAFNEKTRGVYETDNGFLEIQSLASCRVFHESQQDSHKEAQDEGYKARTKIEVCEFHSLIEIETCGEVVGEDLLQTRAHTYDESDLLDMSKKDLWGSRNLSCLNPTNSGNRNDFESAEEISGSDEKMPMESSSETDAAETFFKANNLAGREEEQPSINAGIDSHQQISKSGSNLKRPIKVKPVADEQELRPFNPREPQYLPVEPDPEKEKVDLRHQMMDERKNTEEWMLDYALQQTVTKLAPARKKKVALLVEAFETIKPLPKYENHPHQPRPVPACR